jgi:hypothetical protein
MGIPPLEATVRSRPVVSALFDELEVANTMENHLPFDMIPVPALVQASRTATFPRVAAACSFGKTIESPRGEATFTQTTSAVQARLADVSSSVRTAYLSVMTSLDHRRPSRTSTQIPLKPTSLEATQVVSSGVPTSPSQTLWQLTKVFCEITRRSTDCGQMA